MRLHLFSPIVSIPLCATLTLAYILSVVTGCSSSKSTSKELDSQKLQALMLKLESRASTKPVFSVAELDDLADFTEAKALEDTQRKSISREYSKILYQNSEWERFFALVDDCKIKKICDPAVFRLEALALLRLCQIEPAKVVANANTLAEDSLGSSIRTLVEYGSKSVPSKILLGSNTDKSNSLRVSKWPEIVGAKLPLRLKRVRVKNLCEDSRLEAKSP